MKQTNVRRSISLYVLPVLVFLATGVVFAQGPPRGTPEARALDLMDLLDSIEGVDEEPPRVFKTKEGYLRFIMAPPSAASPSLRPGHCLSGNSSPHCHTNDGRGLCLETPRQAWRNQWLIQMSRYR